MRRKEKELVGVELRIKRFEVGLVQKCLAVFELVRTKTAVHLALQFDRTMMLFVEVVQRERELAVAEVDQISLAVQLLDLLVDQIEMYLLGQKQ